jgi:hypothetical protein
LAATEEWIGGKLCGNLGEVLIRCNNVLYIRGVKEDEEQPSTTTTTNTTKSAEQEESKAADVDMQQK